MVSTPGTDGQILDALGVALLAVDVQGRIQRLNAQAEALLGVAAPQVLSRVCSEVIDSSLCGEACPLRVAMATHTSSRQGTAVIRTADQNTALVELTASFVVDENGEPSGGVALLRDVRADTGELRCYGRRVFISRTPSMRRLFDDLPRLAASDAPLLIQGERGSGRAALAEIVHGLEPERAGEPLRRVLCGEARATTALQQVLVTLDGEDADRGSLLLEDLDAASLDLQQLVLGWLEDREQAPSPRLLSTASSALQQRLERGEFRRDLFHRLAVLQVRLPDLRERHADLPLLAQEFVADLNQCHGRQVHGLSPAAMQQLCAAELPSNVRELRQILERAHARCQGPLIDVADLQLPSPGEARGATLDAERVRQALTDSGGNLSRAARLLDVHRSTLWRALRRLGIHR